MGNLNHQGRTGGQDGFALVTMAFFLVLLLSAALLASYPLVDEAKKDTTTHIIDRNDYRFRKALFGEAADQCGTKLVHSGGHYGDYLDTGNSGTKGYVYHGRVTARVFGTLGVATDLGGGNQVEVPEPYAYTADAFWSGYWGKRYLHPLPSDPWDYHSIFSIWGSKGTMYNPFFHSYAAIYMPAICGGTLPYRNFAKGVRGTSFVFSSIAPHGHAVIEVKDYSEDRTRHELRLITLGSGKFNTTTNENIFFREEQRTPFADHMFYRFEQPDRSGEYNYTAENSGQAKLLIQVRDSIGGPWKTMDTRPLVFPPHFGETGIPRYWVNFYG
ncbi:MAG: hypothetical protein PVG49_14995 [Desulfobacteraceae bacterium]|jgi:hypothetical protein